MELRKCLACHQELSSDRFGSNGTLPSGKPRYKPRCKPCNARYENEIFRQKLRLIIGADPKCSECGYNKTFAALEFHHEDPSTKEGIIAHMRNYSLDRLRQEVEKCRILCSCCHKEEHERLAE
jgi:hypothetical protein